MRQVRRHLFLLIGILSISVFFVTEILNRAGETRGAQVLAGPMRVLIVPSYLIWLLIVLAHVAIAGPHPLPQPLAIIEWVFTMVAGLAPYALVDYILERLRRARLR